MRSEAAAVPAVVIDTNAMLDWLLFGDARTAELAAAVQQGQVRWLACRRMRDEFERTLSYPALQRWSPDAAALLAAHDRWVVAADDPPRVTGSGLSCSDADDQVFLDLALASRARWLVTRDRALLRLARRARAFSLSIVQPGHWTAP